MPDEAHWAMQDREWTWPARYAKPIFGTEKGNRLLLLHADAFWTPQRAFEVRARPDAECPHCKQPDGDLEHFWWRCPTLTGPLMNN